MKTMVGPNFKDILTLLEIVSSFLDRFFQIFCYFFPISFKGFLILLGAFVMKKTSEPATNEIQNGARTFQCSG